MVDLSPIREALSVWESLLRLGGIIQNIVKLTPPSIN